MKIMRDVDDHCIAGFFRNSKTLTVIDFFMCLLFNVFTYHMLFAIKFSWVTSIIARKFYGSFHKAYLSLEAKDFFQTRFF